MIQIPFKTNTNIITVSLTKTQNDHQGNKENEVNNCLVNMCGERNMPVIGHSDHFVKYVRIPTLKYPNLSVFLVQYGQIQYRIPIEYLIRIWMYLDSENTTFPAYTYLETEKYGLHYLHKMIVQSNTIIVLSDTLFCIRRDTDFVFHVRGKDGVIQCLFFCTFIL